MCLQLKNRNSWFTFTFTLFTMGFFFTFGLFILTRDRVVVDIVHC